VAMMLVKFGPGLPCKLQASNSWIRTIVEGFAPEVDIQCIHASDGPSFKLIHRVHSRLFSGSTDTFVCDRVNVIIPASIKSSFAIDNSAHNLSP
jgi:hypothetical protein